MTFAWPHLLWLLVLPSALLAWDIAHRRRTATGARPKILRAEAGVRSLKLSSFGASPAAAKSSQPRWWLWLGLTFSLLALARPQWGRLEEPVFEQSREIILAIDLSRSMLAQDVRPSRLERAKLLIRSLLEKLGGERVGLVVFSGTAFLQSPLSSDYEILLEFLPTLGPDYLPEGGTNYRALIDTSLSAFASTASADRYMIVLSDGEATDDDWKARLPELKTKGIRVIGLGVGTSSGSMIPDTTGGFVKDDRGAVVLSKLETGTLQGLAEATGGVYRDASSWVDLSVLLKQTIEAGKKGQFVETKTVRLVERFQWPLALGVWLLFVSFCYEFPVRPRPRDLAVRPGAPVPPPVARPAKPANTPATVAAIALGLLVLFPTARLRAAAVATDMPTAEEARNALTKVVARVSNARAPSAKDWEEFGRETVNWGSGIKVSKQLVPEGPVRDALAAVDLGAQIDPKATDWKSLRQEIEDLLKKPENDDDQQQPGDQNQKQDDKKQEKEEQQEQQKSGDDKNSPEPQSQQDQQSKEKGGKPSEPKENGESAFGNMKDKQDTPPSPPSQNDTQKVGGNEKHQEGHEGADPSLALPLQKLDQLRNSDSPAQLFQMMEGQKKAPKKPAKDW
jgi:Ca-activated chloride channel family protein